MGCAMPLWGSLLCMGASVPQCFSLKISWLSQADFCVNGCGGSGPWLSRCSWVTSGLAPRAQLLLTDAVLQSGPATASLSLLLLSPLPTAPADVLTAYREEQAASRPAVTWSLGSLAFRGTVCPRLCLFWYLWSFRLDWFSSLCLQIIEIITEEY